MKIRENKTTLSEKIINFIITKNKLIEIIFLTAIIISFVCAPFVVVNYDLTNYLSKTTPSKAGLNLMQEQFGYPGTARIMIKDVTLYQAKLYKQKIEAVDGVDTVFWLDMNDDIKKYTDVYESSDFIKSKDIEDYYKDNCAVMDITFDKGDYNSKTFKAIDGIEKIIGTKGKYTGPAVQNKSLTENLSKEMKSAMIIVILVVALILALTTTSWFEPILFLLIMGISIVINAGTNIFLDSVSFITSSVSSVLQMAVAMDYSIFLVHTFTKYKELGKSPSEAIAIAIRESSHSILACGLATIIGFLALTLMKFTIGFDMGIVLAKGILISLLTVIFLMPSLIIRFSKLIEKSTHRAFVSLPKKTSNGIFKIRYAIIILALIIAIPSYVGKDMNNFLFGNASVGASEGTQVYKDEQDINSVFGRSNMLMAIIPNTSFVTEKKLSDELSNLSYVNKVTSLTTVLPDGVPESILPNNITSEFHTNKYARIMIYINTKEESKLSFDCSDKIKAIVHKYYPQKSYLIGATPFTQDIKSTITKDYTFVDILSILGVALVAMIAFRSILIALLLLVPIEIAVYVNMVFPYLVGEKMIFIGYIIVSCIQLAATVDYSILMTNNYLESRSHMARKEATLAAIKASAPPILNSGVILASTGYILYYTSSIAAIGDMGHLIGRGTLLSMALVVLMLPALLYVFDKPITKNIERRQKFQARGREKIKKILGKSEEKLEKLRLGV